MLSILFLIPIALALTALIIWAFLWAVRSGQYDDLERSGKELLYDEIDPETLSSDNSDPVIKCVAENKPVDRSAKS